MTVSVIHIYRGDYSKEYFLDGRKVPQITAYLFHAGGHDDPYPLLSNHARSFQGSILLGQGFLFDDTTLDGTTHDLRCMDTLLRKSKKNSEVIYPYIGVDEVHTHPKQAHHRFVINFRQMDEATVRDAWPDVMRLVEEKVKPDRNTKSDRLAREKWWQHYRPHEDLYATIRGLTRVLVSAQTSKHRVFSFQPDHFVFDKQLNVFAFSSHATFAALQSRPHEVWSLFFGSTFEDRPIYTLGTCFEAFPFSQAFEIDPMLEEIGKAYYEFRAALMFRNNDGLTKTYNRFHDPDDRSSDILELRRLHAAMDRAVLEAYGWHDLAQTATCDFLLDYEEDEEDEDETVGKKSKKKKPWRYRWPNDFRDEVLARLLELNKQRAEQERLTGVAAGSKQAGTTKGSRTKSKKTKTKPSETANWFDSLDAGGDR